jgi:aspartate/methionine/tyrosine aminotransferase
MLCRRGVRQGAVRRRTHTALASLADDVLTLTFNSLSKSYRSCGYRAGWMVVSGDKRPPSDYIEGLNMLANEHAPVRQRARGSGPSRPRWAATRASTTWWREGGRLRKQRDLAYELITDPGRDLRQAAGGAVHVPAPGPGDVSDRGRPAVLSWSCCRRPR